MALLAPPPFADGLVFRVCRGPTCDGRGEALAARLAAYLTDQGHESMAVQAWQSCFGRCADGPNIVVERWRQGKLSEDAKIAAMLGGTHPDYRFEHEATEAQIPTLVERHLDLYWEDR